MSFLYIYILVAFLNQSLFGLSDYDPNRVVYQEKQEAIEQQQKQNTVNQFNEYLNSKSGEDVCAKAIAISTRAEDDPEFASNLFTTLATAGGIFAAGVATALVARIGIKVWIAEKQFIATITKDTLKEIHLNGPLFTDLWHLVNKFLQENAVNHIFQANPPRFSSFTRALTSPEFTEYIKRGIFRPNQAIHSSQLVNGTKELLVELLKEIKPEAIKASIKSNTTSDEAARAFIKEMRRHILLNPKFLETLKYTAGLKYLKTGSVKEVKKVLNKTIKKGLSKALKIAANETLKKGSQAMLKCIGTAVLFVIGLAVEGYFELSSDANANTLTDFLLDNPIHLFVPLGEQSTNEYLNQICRLAQQHKEIALQIHATYDIMSHDHKLKYGYNIDNGGSCEQYQEDVWQY